MKKTILFFSLLSATSFAQGQTASASSTLDINHVKALIMNGGDMHWDIFNSGNAFYEVPKGSNTHSSFASAIWMGGLDASNQLHTSAQTYRQIGNDYWPGPLDTTNGGINSAEVIAYDKIWKVSYSEINNFITQFNIGNVPLTYTPSPDMVNWPAKGTGAKTRNMAPFVDVNNDGNYNWMDGDYPKIKGDQALYFIFNDNYSTHTETGGLPFGVEIHCMAYAYGCPTTINGRNELANTTFYDYKIYNRSNNNYHDVYVGYWTDADLGCYLNDYIGSKIQDNLGFIYNSTSIDNNCSGTNGYQNYPPALGTTVLKGPLAPIADGLDNNNNGVIDEANEQCLMNYFTYYNNNIGSFPVQTTNPSSKYHYYNYLKAQWKDSLNFTCGGNARGGVTPTKFAYPWVTYPGNPCGNWTELTAGNLAGDRRYILSSGPFNLPAKGNTEVEYALVWSVDSSATSNIHIASVNKLITDAQKIRSFYQSNSSNCLLNINVNINTHELFSDAILIFPNPAQSVLQLKTEANLGNCIIKLSDVSGRELLNENSNDINNSVVDVSNLSSGIYFITLLFNNHTSLVKKFVKQ